MKRRCPRKTMKPILSLGCALLAAVGAAQAQSDASIHGRFAMKLKPLTAKDGSVTGIDVSETIDSGSPDAFDVKASITAVMTKGVADRIHSITARDQAGELQFNTKDDTDTSQDVLYRHWVPSRPVKYPVQVEYVSDVQPLMENHGPPLGLKATGLGVSGSGQGFLALPSGSTTSSVVIHWDLSQLTTGSIGAMSLGKGDVVVPGSPDILFEQWYLAGPAFALEDANSKFSAYGLGTPPFDQKEMFAWSDRAYASLTKAFVYLNPPPHYFLFERSLPFPGYATGTAYGPSAMIHTGSEFKPTQNLEYLHTTIFHELTHLWVGEMDKYRPWFIEGFTVYSTATLMYRNHLSTTEEYLREVNRFASEYYSSKARNWPEQRIEESGMADEQARRVPYDRGALYFANLNAEIRHKSGGKRDLYAMLLPVFQARLSGKTFDEAEWEDVLKNELGPDAVERFHKQVLLGEDLVVPESSAFGNCFERKVATPSSSAKDASPLVYEWVLKTNTHDTNCSETESHQDSSAH